MTMISVSGMGLEEVDGGGIRMWFSSLDMRSQEVDQLVTIPNKATLYIPWPHD